MSRNGIAAVILSIGLMCGSASAANYAQPWGGLDAVTSAVTTCATPWTCSGAIAFDDFKVNATTTFSSVRWWGTLDNPNGTVHFRINIFDDAGCVPGTEVFKLCPVLAARAAVGTDCLGRSVYSFQHNLSAAGFTATGGKKYWISISQFDNGSDGVTFNWSGYQAVRGCNAVQIDGSGVVHAPIISACNHNPMDLAFVLID